MKKINRRQFVGATLSAVALGSLDRASLSQAAPAPARVKLGIDNFAVRAMGWKAEALLDYAASLKTDSILISDLDAFESFEDAYLQKVRNKAKDLGIQIHLGTWSICQTSRAFRNKWGNAEEHLTLGIRVAKALGSPVLRVVLGNNEDRKTEGGIEARMADTAKTCKACRSKAIDAGVKIAIENHAGDMQAAEVVQLIEMAGRDYVGANMDSGNAVWTMEDPLASLEILGPYALTTSLRDSAVWESANGATVQWTAMGDGTIDQTAYMQRFRELCPGVPVHIETISGGNREIPYLRNDFWKIWPKMKAADLARFIALAKKGQPRAAHVLPADKDRKIADQEYQKAEIEKSIKYCREVLGLGPV